MASIAELAVMITADASQYSRELNNTLGQTQSWASNIGGTLGGAVKTGFMAATGAAVAGIGALGVGFGVAVKDGLTLNTTLENVEAQLLAFTKDGDAAAKILEDIRIEAAKTPFAFEDMAKATAGLLPAAKASGAELMDLVKQAEILAASNPEQGLEGAAFALREAVSGDFTSVIERFNLPRSEINRLKEEGVPALEIVSRAMQSVGFDMDLVSNLAQTSEGRWSTFWDTIDTLKATLSEPLFNLIKDGLVTVQGLLDANMPTIQAFAQVIGERLAGAIGGTVEGLISFGRYISAILQDGDTLNDWLTHLPEGVQPFAKAVGEAVAFVVENWPKISETVKKAFDTVKDVIESVLRPSLDNAVGRFQWVRDWIDENMPLIQQTVQTVLTAITAFWDEHGERIMTIVRGFMSIVNTVVDTYLKNIFDLFKVVMQLINGDVEGAGETLKAIVERTMSTFLSIVSTYIGMVQDAFGDVDWGAVGRSIIDGIVAGLRGAGHLLVSAAQGAASGAVQGIKDLLGIRSPSRVMADEVGGPIIAGLVQGITSNGRDVVSAAEAIVNQTLAAMDFATNLDSQFGMFGDVFQGAQLEQYLANLATGISGNLSTLGALSLTGGGFVDGGNNSGMGNGNNITINIYTNDASMAGDSVVQSLRAYGLAA